MHNPYPLFEHDVRICQQIQKNFATNYYLATLLFPKTLREATFILYAFFRLPDEIVDTTHGQTVAQVDETLQAFIKTWETIYHTEYSTYTETDEMHAVLRATAYVFHTYNIPYQCSVDFLHAMAQDVHISRYETYEALCQYMYGSAAVVGLMMTYVIGCSDTKAYKYAETLGYAMQMSNFLRDVYEDYTTRQRIYLPHKDLVAHGLSYDDIMHYCNTKTIDARWVAYMKSEITRTREQYAVTERDGIPLLTADGRRATRIALRLYRGILDEIEKQGYNVFAKRASVPLWRKIAIIMYSYIR